MNNNAVVEALQAELRRITDDRDAKSSRMWELGKQCDALEEELAALKQSLAQPAQETEGQKFNRLLEQESAVEALHSDFLENFEYPDYNVQAMGHGLEDRGITDRYEAMAYGWQEAVDTLAEMIQDWFAAAPEVQPSQPSAPVVPEEWKLVPIEATNDMIDAALALDEGNDDVIQAYRDLYSAMLDAVEFPPTEPQRDECLEFQKWSATATYEDLGSPWTIWQACAASRSKP